MSWCFFKVDKRGSERLLLEHGKDGSFLVRSSFNGQKTLSVRNGDVVSHIDISWNGDSYGFGKSMALYLF